MYSIILIINLIFAATVAYGNSANYVEVAADNPLNNAVAEFAHHVLQEWASDGLPLQAEGVARVTRFSGNILPMEGTLSDVEMHGLHGTTQIFTRVESIGMEGKGLEYGFRIENLELIGNYNLNGSLATFIPLVAEGRFKITFRHPVDFYCNAIATTKAGGYLLLDSTCSDPKFNFSAETAVAEFPGLVQNSPFLDPILIQDIYLNIAQSAAWSGGLRDMTFKALANSTLVRLQNAFDKKRLLEIVSSTSNRLSNKNSDDDDLVESNLLNARMIDQDENISPINDRLTSFILATMLKFPEKAEDPMNIPKILTWDTSRSVLLPLNGTLTNIKFFGLSGLSVEDVSLRNGVSSIYVDMKMTNISLSGSYDLSGSIARGVPFSGVGTWSFSMTGECSLMFDGFYKIVNGFLVWERHFVTGFECLAVESSRTEFPGLFESANLEPHVSQVCLDTLGSFIVGSLYNLMGAHLLGTAVTHLQSSLNVSSIIDIITRT